MQDSACHPLPSSHAMGRHRVGEGPSSSSCMQKAQNRQSTGTDTGRVKKSYMAECQLCYGMPCYRYTLFTREGMAWQQTMVGPPCRQAQRGADVSQMFKLRMSLERERRENRIRLVLKKKNWGFN